MGLTSPKGLELELNFRFLQAQAKALHVTSWHPITFEIKPGNLHVKRHQEGLPEKVDVHYFGMHQKSENAENMTFVLSNWLSQTYSCPDLRTRAHGPWLKTTDKTLTVLLAEQSQKLLDQLSPI